MTATALKYDNSDSPTLETSSEAKLQATIQSHQQVFESVLAHGKFYTLEETIAKLCNDLNIDIDSLDHSHDQPCAHPHGQTPNNTL